MALHGHHQVLSVPIKVSLYKPLCGTEAECGIHFVIFWIYYVFKGFLNQHDKPHSVSSTEGFIEFLLNSLNDSILLSNIYIVYNIVHQSYVSPFWIKGTLSWTCQRMKNSLIKIWLVMLVQEAFLYVRTYIAYVHTYIHTHIHYMRTYIHTYIHIYTHMYTPTYICIYILV